MTKFDLVFHDADSRPIQHGTYLLYNQCDGYHIADAVFEEDEWFAGFRFWTSSELVDKDFFRAWAYLPDSVHTMFKLFGSTQRSTNIA